MVGGQEETFTNQVGRRRGPNRESPTASSLVASMSVEELRSFCRVPNDISLELSDGSPFSTIGEADNAVYFTWEQFAAGFRFTVLSLMKQFLHVTRAPPALIHPNIRLDISLVEICFIYTLKLKTGPAIYVGPYSMATICNRTP